MPYADLREFLDRLDEAGELVRITESVRADLEITAWADRMMKRPDGGKALLICTCSRARHSQYLAFLARLMQYNTATDRYL